MYQVINQFCVERIEDGAVVGVENPDYLAWRDAGNTPAPAAPPPPAEVTMRQAQLAMLAFTYQDGTNLLDKVNTLIAQQPRASQITWNASSVVQRGNALIAGLQPALGLTDAQIDQLFITAAGL